METVWQQPICYERVLAFELLHQFKKKVWEVYVAYGLKRYYYNAIISCDHVFLVDLFYIIIIIIIIVAVQYMPIIFEVSSLRS